MFAKYEDEAIFAASQCGLSVGTYIKLESVAAVVDDANIMITNFIIICNYIIYSFGKRAILIEEEEHNLVTGYMEAEYGTYKYDRYKGMEK